MNNEQKEAGLASDLNRELGAAAIAANGRVDRNIGRHGNLLPAEAKPMDECPWCAPSGHTGVFDQTTGKYVVCKVCGDKGFLSAWSIEYYGTPKVTHKTV